MKKLWGPLLLLAAVLGGVIYYVLVGQGTAVTLALPAGPTLVVHAREIDKALAELEKTKVWKNISKIDLEASLQKAGTPPEQVAQVLAAKDMLTSHMARLMLPKFFGKEVAIAYYSSELTPADFATPQMAFLEKLNIVVLTRISKDAEFFDFLSRGLSFAENLKKTSQDYQGVRIHSVVPEGGPTIVYANVKDTLIIAFSPALVKSCLDVLQGNKPSVNLDERFKEVHRRVYPQARMEIFLDAKSFTKGMRSLL